jgi:hypothetical protein
MRKSKNKSILNYSMKFNQDRTELIIEWDQKPETIKSIINALSLFEISRKEIENIKNHILKSQKINHLLSI